MLENCFSKYRRMKLDLYLTSYKNQLKWIKDINVRHEAIETIRSIYRKSSSRHWNRQSSLFVCFGQGTKSKSRQMILHQTEHFFHNKRNNYQVKRQLTMQAMHLTYHMISYKESKLLVSCRSRVEFGYKRLSRERGRKEQRNWSMGNKL